MNLSVNINVCRVCMQANSGTSLLEDNNLKEKFVFTTRLKTSIHDDLPVLICNKCQNRLRISYDFIKLAHESEKNLKAFLARIIKDFQLVASNTTKDKINENENEDEEDELELEVDYDNDKASREAEETNKRLVTAQSSTSTTSLLAPTATKIRNKSIADAEENHKQAVPKKRKNAVEEMREIGTNDTNSELLDANFKSEHTDGEPRDYEFEPEVMVGLEEETNLQNLSSADNQNPTTPEHEIQILEYSEEDSQVELEILEENLQQSEDAHSSRDGMERSTPGNDGFLLEESDEYVEDNNAMTAETAASTSNEAPLYDASEELLDAGDDTNIEMEAIGIESHMNSKDVTMGTETMQEQPNTTQNIETGNGVNIRGKNKRSSVKTNARGTAGSGKTSAKADIASTSKRFFCEKCKRDFSTKTNLTRHMISHEGMRPYQCNVCNKSFTQNVTLKQHMYTHTGEKPYQCEFCDRGFTQCKSLVFHLRRHTGEKPFPCEKCGALFRQKDGLKTHILKRHTIKSLSGNTELITCAICKEDFVDNNSLQEHMKKHLSDYVRVDSAMSFSNREANKDENQVLLEVLSDETSSDQPTFFLIDQTAESVSEINSSAHVVDLMTTSALEPSRAKKFQCRKCFKCFAIKHNLIRHLATHDTASESTINVTV